MGAVSRGGFLAMALLAISGGASSAADGQDPADRPYPTIAGKALKDVPDDGLHAAMASPETDAELRSAIRREIGTRGFLRAQPRVRDYRESRYVPLPPDPLVLVDGRPLRDVPDARLAEVMAAAETGDRDREAIRRETVIRAMVRSDSAAARQADPPFLDGGLFWN